MLRSILSVLAGWASVGILVVLTDLVLGKVFPGEYVAGQMPPDRLAALSLGTSTLYSVLGGWITVKLAARQPWRHAVYLILWGELMGVLSAVMTWGQIQSWYQMGLLATWPAAIAAGCWLAAGSPLRASGAAS
ncbi:MAG: hypothetical protein WHT08_06240 [Bryobacteraceae bacterium]